MLRALLLLLLTLSLVQPLISPASSLYTVTALNSEEAECFELYFVNAIYFMNSTGVFKGFLETPANYSSPPYRQEVHILYMWGNTTFNRSDEAVEIWACNGTSGGFIAKVRICGRSMHSALEIIKEAYRDPNYGKLYDEIDVPRNITSKYLLEPATVIVEKVKPEFEEWISREKGVLPSNMSKLSLAVDAAFFIYNIFIEYNPSALPRTMEEVIEKREGDCDDMSRILLNLLWSYGIPAKIAQGYVYLNLSMESPVGSSLYIFEDAGPHAFVMAYIPGLGWIPLDFLAGSMLVYPFVFEGETVFTNISKELVEEVEELHRKHVFVQMMSLLNAKEFRELTREDRDFSRLALWAMSRVVLRAAQLSGLQPTEPMPRTVTETVTLTKTLTETVTHMEATIVEKESTRTITETTTVEVTRTVEHTKTVTVALEEVTTITYSCTTTLLHAPILPLYASAVAVIVIAVLMYIAAQRR